MSANASGTIETARIPNAAAPAIVSGALIPRTTAAAVNPAIANAALPRLSSSTEFIILSAIAIGKRDADNMTIAAAPCIILVFTSPRASAAAVSPARTPMPFRTDSHSTVANSWNAFAAINTADAIKASPAPAFIIPDASPPALRAAVAPVVAVVAAAVPAAPAVLAAEPAPPAIDGAVDATPAAAPAPLAAPPMPPAVASRAEIALSVFAKTVPAPVMDAAAEAAAPRIPVEA